MDINLQPGKYVVAVSGGVDSVALLHALLALPGVELIVAHYDHGIRPDSGEDVRLVELLAHEYGLPFEVAHGRLGPDASEALARERRYTFLHSTRLKYDAQAIITAHHQDDVLETVVLNLLRGTGSRGLASLRSTDTVVRPLLGVTKKELRAYAEANGLRWREDSTNANPKYLRNYIRLKLLPKFSAADRQKLLDISARAAELNRQITHETADILATGGQSLRRDEFNRFPEMVQREIMYAWLREHTHAEISRKLIARLVDAARTGRNNSKVDVDGQFWLEIGRHQINLQRKK